MKAGSARLQFLCTVLPCRKRDWIFPTGASLFRSRVRRAAYLSNWSRCTSWPAPRHG